MGRAWTKVGMWEMRVFDDLRAFTTREGNFRFVRDATLEASSEGKGCIPFLGASSVLPPVRVLTCSV